MTRRWLFGDQLGSHFLDAHDQPVLLVESTDVLRRKRFHRRKAHLVLSAMRHRAAELGDQATYLTAPTYAEAVAGLGDEHLDVVDPTTYGARRLVRRLARRRPLTVLPSRGFAVTERDFAVWAGGRGGRRLLMEDFYREVRRHHRLLLTPDGGPEGGSWNYDVDNREPPPRGAASLDVPEPWWPAEDDLDAQVRDDLDRMARDEAVEFVGDDGPRRFAVTRREALAALRHFLSHRLDAFGTYEDAMLAGDRWMAHSLLSVPLNLGLLDPVEVARRAEAAYREDGTRLASVEGFVRQVVGWRDYAWHLYWWAGEEYRHRDALGARAHVPAWFDDLDVAGRVTAACLSDVLRGVREEGWVHHVPRLMVLGNYALQQGWSPREVTDWFHRSFVDGYDWVMVPNVVGMALHADGGLMATKPYAAGGAYVNRMSDYCRSCAYDPRVRVGERACPFTAGYWAFLDRSAEHLDGNHRMARPLAALRRLADREAVVEQVRRRGRHAP